MAGFRVAYHHAWRHVPPVAEPAPEAPSSARPPPDPVRSLERQVRALGAVAYPARAYDLLFGRFEKQGKAYLAVRFVLVLATILLLIGGAQGTSILAAQQGEFKAVTPGATINLYLAPHSATRYPVQVLQSDHSATALFGYDQGLVRLPDDGSQYAFRLRVVRYDPQVDPVVLFSVPGEGYQRLRPSSDDGVTLRFDEEAIPTTGVYGLLLTSTRSIGHVDLHLQLARADVSMAETFQPDWLPLIGGIGLGTIMIGAYTPGAALLRDMRRLAGA